MPYPPYTYVVMFSDNEFEKLGIRLAFGKPALEEVLKELSGYNVIGILTDGESMVLKSKEELRRGFTGV